MRERPPRRVGGRNAPPRESWLDGCFLKMNLTPPQARQLPLDRIIFLRIISLHPVPRDRGVSDQRLQTRGGERWPVGGVGDTTPLPQPAVQAASFWRASRAPRAPDGRGRA